MKLILLGLLAVLVPGCSLCLFNCGGTSSPADDHTVRWEDRTTFKQYGLNWMCHVEINNPERVEVTDERTGRVKYGRRAVCWSQP